MSKTPYGNSACVLIQDPYTGLILGVSRKDNPDDFGLPGGKCDPGEDYLTTALRELREETGVLLKKAPVLCFTAICVGGKDGKDYLTKTFRTSVSAEYIKIQTTEKGVVQWITPAKLLEGSFADYHRAMLAHIGLEVK